MSVSQERLRDASAVTGFRPEALEKVIRLGELASDVFNHPFLGPALALKGGTALNLAFGPPPRLSVDLDFNYVASLEREVMLRDRPEVERALEQLAHGRKELWQPGDMARPRARVVPVEELAAGKLCALLARAAPRDLYDAIRLPHRLGGVWRSPGFRRVFVAVAGILDHPLFGYGPDRFERVNDDAVRTQLHPMLTAGDEPSADVLRVEAWAAVAPFLALAAGEREYCERLQLGEFQPELLFPEGGSLADRVRRHPALLWKAQNARQHAGGRHGP